MKKSIVLLINFLLTISLFAQDLRFSNECNTCFRAIDNRINIRTEPNTNSTILGQLWEYEIIYVNKEKSTKEWLFCSVPKINSLAYVYADYFKETPDYNNENGTIIFEKKDKNQTITIRKHKQVIKEIYIDDNKTISVMSNYIPDAKILGSIKNGETITVNKVMTKELNKKTEVWLEIAFNNSVGWIFVSDKPWANPYSTYGFYSILYYKEINSEKIPVRNIELQGRIWEPVNLYKEPYTESDVMTQAHMTFKKFIDDNNEEYYLPEDAVWLKGNELIYINNKPWIYTNFEGIYGWACFNELSVERGGYKIYTPEIRVLSLFDPPA